jgi:hypothetical protein
MPRKPAGADALVLLLCRHSADDMADPAWSIIFPKLPAPNACSAVQCFGSALLPALAKDPMDRWPSMTHDAAPVPSRRLENILDRLRVAPTRAAAAIAAIFQPRLVTTAASPAAAVPIPAVVHLHGF